MIKTHVVSREIAKQLKNAGFPQETVFCWYIPTAPDVPKYYRVGERYEKMPEAAAPIAAPLLSEVLTAMPPEAFRKFLADFADVMEYGSSMPDAAGKFWLWWKEQK